MQAHQFVVVLVFVDVMAIVDTGSSVFVQRVEFQHDPLVVHLLSQYPFHQSFHHPFQPSFHHPFHHPCHCWQHIHPHRTYESTTGDENH
jgi:hypothetical protein